MILNALWSCQRTTWLLSNHFCDQQYWVLSGDFKSSSRSVCLALLMNFKSTWQCVFCSVSFHSPEWVMSLRPRLVAFSCPVLVRLAPRQLREWAPKRKKRRKRPETVFGLYRVIALSSASCLPYLGLYFPLRGTFMFNICRVCIQYESFNNFENDTNNESVNEIKLTGFWARNRAAIQQNFLPGPQSYRDFRETKLRSCLTLSLHGMSCCALLVLLFSCPILYFTCLSLYLHALSHPA